MVRELQEQYRCFLRKVRFKWMILFCWMMGASIYLGFADCHVIPSDALKTLMILMPVVFMMWIFDVEDMDEIKLSQVLVSVFASWFATAQYVGFYSDSLYLCKQPWKIQSMSGWVFFVAIYLFVAWFCFWFRSLDGLD